MWIVRYVLVLALFTAAFRVMPKGPLWRQALAALLFGIAFIFLQ